MSTDAGGVRSMLTRMQIQDFLVSGARLYYRGPEVYLYGYKYSTLGGGFTATLSFRQPAHIYVTLRSCIALFSLPSLHRR